MKWNKYHIGLKPKMNYFPIFFLKITFPYCSPGRIVLDNKLLKIEKINIKMIIINHVLIKRLKLFKSMHNQLFKEYEDII